ncbi:MAG: LysR family transcriptional regulator [Sideroxydans sp.]|nr:LysR family transcriptional regulator [Sideroxydans sp.]
MGGIWLGQDDEPMLGDVRIALLEQIDETGSISKAAKAVGISYKTAWDAVDSMKNLSGEPLVESASGGKGGGGTRLSEAARKLVQTYRLIQQEHERFLASLSDGIDDFQNSYQLIRRLSMKSSARNQFFGRITAIRGGSVNAEVELSLNGDDKITAIITHESLENLDLKIGGEAWALIKASWVIITTGDSDFKLSVRNRLCGTVSRLTKGQVNSDVVLTLTGGNTVSAIVTNDSVEQMGLKEGAKACAIFKASSVILGIAA